MAPAPCGRIPLRSGGSSPVQGYSEVAAGTEARAPMSNSTLTNLARQEKTRSEILHKSDLIPPLPDFVVRLLALLNKPDTEPRHLEQQLQSDQVLVAKMLAMVNS